MEKIDFATVKANVTIDSVLARYGVQTKKRNSTYLVANCPLPTHTSRDSAFSFAINIEKNLWTCHSDSCKKASGMKGGDVIDVVCLMEGTRTPLDGARKLVEWFPHINALRNQNAPHDAGRNGNGAGSGLNHNPASEQNKPLAFTLKDINPEHELIQSRGITIETAKLFGVGYFPGKGSMAGRIVFPLQENGLLIGYAGRLVGEPTAEQPKWKLPSGLVKSFLYGIERCDPTKLIVVTESLWSPLWLYQQGAQAASLMGSDMTEAQERCLEPFGLICVAMDNDAKGREATEKITARLRRNHKVMKATLKEG